MCPECGSDNLIVEIQSGYAYLDDGGWEITLSECMHSTPVCDDCGEEVPSAA